MEYYSTIESNGWLIHITIWMNFKIIILNERSQRVRTVWFYLYKILEYAHESIAAANQWLASTWGEGEKWKRVITKEHKKTFRGDGYIRYLYYADGFMEVSTCQNLWNCTLHAWFIGCHNKSTKLFKKLLIGNVLWGTSTSTHIRYL